jgi:hypothetical protein
MKAMSIAPWVFVVAAALGFVAAVVVKIIGYPVAFELYPRSFMSFTNTCLLFAVVLLLMRLPLKKK